MGTIIISLFAKFWPAIVGVFGIAGGVLFGWAKTKSANTTKAQAQQQIAQQAAQVASGSAQASAAAETAVANRVQADQDATRTPDADLDAQLERLGALRKER